MDNSNFTIGDKGTYSFQPPYDNILSSVGIYEVTNLTSINNLVTHGSNPFVNIYELYGMSIDDFNSDVDTNIGIVELSMNKKTYYVPVNRIDTKTMTDAISYTEKGIGIKLGFIPSDENLDILLNKIDELITATVGLEPVMNLTELSSSVNVTQTAHDARTLIRDDLKTAPGNFKVMYEDNSVLLTEALLKLELLETAAINTINNT